MSFPVTIALTASEHASTVPVVDPGSASGIFSLTWLVIALPLAGAAILLLGGRRTDRWGHLLGAALPIGSLVLSVLMFVELLGRDEAERQVGQHLYTWFQVGTLDVGFDLLYDPLSALFLLLITGVGSLIHVYSIRIPESRGDLQEAVSLADRAILLAEGDTRRRSYLPQLFSRRAEIYVKMRRFAQARTDAERSIALARERIPAESHAAGIGIAYLALGEAHAGEGRRAEARISLTSALEHLEATAGAEHPAARRAKVLLDRSSLANLVPGPDHPGIRAALSPQ